MQAFFTKHKLHFVAIISLLLVAFIYFLPTFSGRSHRMEDAKQSKLTMLEAEKYYEEEGKVVGWTNQIFGGMPTDLIFLGPAPNLFNFFNYLTPFKGTSIQFQNLLLLFLGFYVFLICLGVDPRLALFGSLAYGFLTFTFSSLEAAHYNKVLVMGLLPATIGGLYLLAKQKYLAGFVVFTYHFALQIYYFHYQITYYGAIIMGIIGLFYVVKLLSNKQIKPAILMVVLALVGVGIGIGANLQKLATTQNYAKYTMRGGSALNESESEGLAIDYAFSWSYGVGETFTILIPGIYGGSSAEAVSERSPLYKKYNNPDILNNKWPLYHGPMPMTSGPVYFGALIMFLFILSFKLVKSDLRWPLYIAILISFVMSWGKHFMGFNAFLFEYLPYYNKFRTPMMAMTIAQIGVLTLAILSLKALMEQKVDKAFFKQFILKPFYFLGGLVAFIMIFGGGIIDTSNPADYNNLQGIFGGLQGAQKEQAISEFTAAIQESRAHLITMDSLRSLFFIAAGVGLLWLLSVGKIKKNFALIAIGSLMVIDLVGIDMRYLTWDNFKEKSSLTDVPMKDNADLQIHQDADPHYRVMDLSRNSFNSNDAGVYHKLVGGYHAAKLSRYQDLIDKYLIKNQRPNELAMDMMNCKYYIVPNKQGQRESVFRNTALGNAWFVEQIVTTMSDKEEMDSLVEIDPAYQAVINIESQSIQSAISEDIGLKDSNANIQLYSYHPDTLRYNYQSNYQRFVVFSEIHYPYWKLYVNGKETPLYKVNYTLRGAVLPPGEGDIEMVYTYKPAEVYAAPTRLFSLLIILLVLGAIVWNLRKSSKPKVKVA